MKTTGKVTKNLYQYVDNTLTKHLFMADHIKQVEQRIVDYGWEKDPFGCVTEEGFEEL